METNFQTSFIPKKPVLVSKPEPKSKSINILLVFSILIFFTILIATGALYFYKSSMQKDITQMKNDLVLAKDRFEFSKITQLELFNRRLEASTIVLNNHVAISPIFLALQDITMKTVRYTKFDYTLEGEKAKKIKVSLEGNARDYRSIALQSDLFNKNKYFINPIFSNLSLTSKGDIQFTLTFEIDPMFVNYQRVLEGTNILN